MKKVFVLILVLIISLQTYSQNKNKVNLYFNEDFENINQSEFNLRKNCYLFYEKKIETDTTIVHHLKQTIKFGTLNSNEYKQLRLILSKSYGIDASSNKTLILQYKDTLFGFYERKIKSKPYIHTIPNGDTLNISLTKSLYIKRRKVFDDYQKKCIRKVSKKNIIPIYLYTENVGYNYENKNVNWKKVNRIVKNIFFNNGATMIYLKSNGDYFSFTEWYRDKTESLLYSNDWSKPMSDYSKILNTLSQVPIGFFNHKTKRTNSSSTYRLPLNSNKEDFRRAHISHQLNSVKSDCYLYSAY
ncbi:hypothetical protein [uncultured Psychroserpens sp.]|uniref:hypothetical protein n=1 Tax=uncultured Psychroserpens sp. TaxID=255436 RepID=UPI002624ECFF|nr:hypothetical protein [uncultured Psychroserpens sp.]